MNPVTDPELIDILDRKAGIGKYSQPDIANNPSYVTDPDLINILNKKAGINIDTDNKLVENLPWVFKQGLGLIPSLSKPLKESIPERTQALGRGLSEIGQGAKQLYLEQFGKPGEAEKYTKEKEAEKQFYETTPASKDYLSNLIRKNVSSLPEYVALGVPFAGETGLLSKMLLSGGSLGTAKGSEFVPEGESRLMNVVKGTAEGAAFPLVLKTPELLIKGAEKIGAPFARLGHMEKEAEKAKDIYTGYTEQENALKEQAKQQLGKSDYSNMEYNLGKNKEKLSEINNQLEHNLPKPEDYLLESPKESEKRVLNSQIVSDKAKNTLQDIDNQISENLNHGDTHDVEAARIIKKSLNENKNNISDNYNLLKNNLKDENIVIDNSGKLKELNNDLFKLVQEGKSHTKQAMELHNSLDNISKRDIIPANDYISLIKSTNGYMREAFNKAYEPGINEDQRNLWLKKANELKDKLEEMNTHLELNLSGSNLSLLRDSNKRWKNEVIPLYDDPTYWRIMNDEKMSKDMVSELRGGAPGSAKEIIRNTIKNNPQALKHIVGQKHDSGKLDDIYNPNKEMKQYTDLMPDLQSLVQKRKEAELLSNKADQRVKLHKTFRDEAKSLNESYEKEIGKKENLQKQKEDLEKTISLLENHIPKLKEVAESKRLSLKDHIQAKNKLKRAEMKRSKARTKLKMIIGLTAGSYGLGKLISYSPKLLESGEG